MNFLAKNILTNEEVNSIRSQIIEKQNNFEKKKHLGENFVENIVFRMKHRDVCKINKLIQHIVSEKIVNFLKQRFSKLYLINFFELTANGYSHRLHRDGQSLGFNKKGLEFSEKIFKVVFYFNNYESKIIKIGIFPSKPLKFFNEEKKFIKINYYLEHYFKKHFLKDSGYQNGDALIFDSNTWHKAKPTKEVMNLDPSQLNKIIASYELVVDDIEIANSYASFMKKKYDVKTSYKTDFDKSLHSNLNLFDGIFDLK